MVAINFPDSPTNGQEHAGYVWDATNNVWNRLPTLPALDLINFSAVAPSNPQDGQFWFDTTVGKMYVYYNDGSSSQWVSAIGGLASQQGTEGQLLIHDGSEWVATDGKSRNLVYNGAMQVHQRGTSANNITSTGYYTADRWKNSVVSMGTWTQTVEAAGPTGSGFTKSLKVECTTADASPAGSDRVFIQQLFEGQDLQSLNKGTSDASTLTLSFWVKSNVTGTYVVAFFDYDNVRGVSQQYTVSSSDTWEKKTITIPADTSGAFDNNNAVSLGLNFFLGAGSDRTSGTLQTAWGPAVSANEVVGQVNLAETVGNYWQVTGVQLEVGAVATPYEHKSYGVELAECQRYYYKLESIAGNGDAAPGWNADSTRTQSFVAFPVEMRTEPTALETTGTASDYQIIFANTVTNCSEIPSFIGATKNNSRIRGHVASGLTTGQGSAIRLDAAGSFLAWSAEL